MSDEKIDKTDKIDKEITNLRLENIKDYTNKIFDSLGHSYKCTCDICNWLTSISRETKKLEEVE